MAKRALSSSDILNEPKGASFENLKCGRLNQDTMSSPAAGKQVAVEEITRRFLDEEGKITARVTSHFLPKFDNQRFEKGVAALLAPSDANPDGSKADNYDNCYFVSKKHSGSLLMAPPFYSKNATGNKFSRLGAVLLYKHFCNVWGDQGKTKFYDWWNNAEASRLCYSFELVVPRILGDHGATPKCSYLVLICVARTGLRRFMSPAELILEAIRWRLPLNEMWLIDGSKAMALEKDLLDARWRMTDDEASKILEKYLEPGNEPQKFLSHSETQGSVLEGFVCMAIRCDRSRFSELLKEYNREMVSFREAALSDAQEMGNICLDENSGAALLRSLGNLAIEPLNHSMYVEPAFLPSQDIQELIWQGLIRKVDCDQLRKTLELLQKLYRRSAKLHLHYYRERIQVQVSISEDEVFYAWPLHSKGLGCSELFRGMVITLEPFDEANSMELEDAANKYESLTKAQEVSILGISKIKCLNYIWRTFGVRNLLPTLTMKGKDAYLKAIRRTFLKNWHIPSELVPEMEDFFTRWADFVDSLPRSVKRKLNDNGYLSVLENEFLPNAAIPCSQTTAVEDNMRVCLAIANFSGLPNAVIEDRMVDLGLIASEKRIDPEKCDGLQGTWTWLSGSKLSTAQALPNRLLIVFSPNQGKINRSSSSLDGEKSNIEKRIEGQYASFMKKLKINLPGDDNFCQDPLSAHEWISLVRKRQARAAEVEAEAELKKKLKVKLPLRYLVCIVGLPPGGGKTTFFRAMESAYLGSFKTELGYSFISSDDFSGNPRRFKAELQKILYDDSVGIEQQIDPKVVGYDKNIRAFDSFCDLIDTVKKVTSKVDLRLVCIVPKYLKHDIFWKRVRDRKPSDHKSLAIGKKEKLTADRVYQIYRGFFNACSGFASTASRIPGVISTDCFTMKENCVHQFLQTFSNELFSKFLKPELAGAAFSEMEKYVENRSNSLKWCCVDIDGHTGLHVTLIPPTQNNVRIPPNILALDGKSVKVFTNRFHIATRLKNIEGPEKKQEQDRIAFWEVDRIQGLPVGINLGEQGNRLHISDVASVSRGVQPKVAAELMDSLKRNIVHPDGWCLESLTCIQELDGKIRLMRN